MEMPLPCASMRWRRFIFPLTPDKKIALRMFRHSNFSLVFTPFHPSSFLLLFPALGAACGISVTWPGIEPGALAMRTLSPTCWTTKEFPFLRIQTFKLHRLTPPAMLFFVLFCFVFHLRTISHFLLTSVLEFHIRKL